MSTTFTVRAATLDDLSAVTELFNEHSRRLHGVADETAEEILQYWESPDVDFEKEVIVAEGSDGSIVGYGDVGESGDSIWLDIRALDPQPQQALLEALEPIAHERKPGARLLGFVTEKDADLRRVYEEHGYQVIRHSYRMEIELGDRPEIASETGGFSIRTMREGEEEQVYEVHEQSFEDAWMHTREPFEQWRHWFVKDPSFDPSLWFLAEADGELVGVAICNTRGHDSGLGWVRILGVLRSHRRRGIGEALLRHAFAEFERRGFERVGLGVDAESPTGAVALYERAGMHVARRSIQLEKLQG
jgi:ribosomal protein S18 acetylase RimI-like enzyme